LSEEKEPSDRTTMGLTAGSDDQNDRNPTISNSVSEKPFCVRIIFFVTPFLSGLLISAQLSSAFDLLSQITFENAGIAKSNLIACTARTVGL
jgi:hypothetical protein